MAIQLNDKVAIVTGGAMGIGEAVAHKLASLGARVLVAGLPGDPVPEVVNAIRDRGGKAEGFIGDVAVESQAEECVLSAVDLSDRLDILINASSTQPTPGSIDHYRVSEFDRAIFANIRSVFLMTRFALPHLRKSKGCIVSAGTETGGFILDPVHGATKAWIHSFMKGVAEEAAEDGVRANTVCTGPIDPAWTHAARGEFDPDVERRIVQATPLGRMGRPEEAANVFAFLASDEASFVTGAIYSADGGIAAGSAVGRAARIKRSPERPHRNGDAFL